MWNIIKVTFICQAAFAKGLSKNIQTKVSVKPKTLNQVNYVKAMQNNNLVFCMGPAGTGKTLLACVEAMNQLQRKEIDKIVITRPIVSVEDEQLGFLPGNINKKMDPWTRPIFDIFSEYFSMNNVAKMIKNGVIEISPLAYMRGRTFKNSFIIADEMQNSSPNQMLMLTTRIGTNTKMVITGDLKQTDRQGENGLTDFMNKFLLYNTLNCGISMVSMTKEDVERSEIVKTIMDIYNQESYYQKVVEDVKPVKSAREIALLSDAALIPLRQVRAIAKYR